MIRLQTCTSCETPLSILLFERRDTPSGYRKQCKPCINTRRRARRAESLGTIKCLECKEEFQKKHENHKFCSSKCSNIFSKKNSSRKYLAGLITPQRKEDGLSVDILEKLWNKQEGHCALSGKRMTMFVGCGSIPTNVSIDRIKAGGSYSEDNIQLVCSAVNSFRRDLEIQEFLEWCIAVADYNLGAKQAAGGRKSKRK